MSELKYTGRGFGLIQFKDLYSEVCSIQKSSLATDDAIWFGVDNSMVKMLASQAQKINPETGEMSGWVNVELPEGAEIMPTRMHLNREQVRQLIPILTYFAENGELPKNYADIEPKEQAESD